MLSFKMVKHLPYQSGKYQPKLILHITHCFPLEYLKLHLKNSIATHLFPAGNPGTCNAVFTVVNTASVPKILPGAGDVGLSPSVFPVNVTAPGTVVVNLFIKGTQSSHFNYSKSALYYKM